LSEDNIQEALREIRVALLEADVNFKVVRGFVDRVREKAVGQDVLKSLTPAQQVVKVVHDELVELLGGSGHRLAMASHPPTVIMLMGLQGSGKTTTAAKLARTYGKQGPHPILAAADIYRPPRALRAPRDRPAHRLRRHGREDRRARALPSRPPGLPHPRHGRRAVAGREGPAGRRPGTSPGDGAEAPRGHLHPRRLPPAAP